MENYDVAVIGGGVVGCSILNKLTRLGLKCVLLEIADDVATGMSRANTGLIHAGFDAKENSLKQKLNVSGNKMFDKLCEELSVPFNRIGALVVGNDPREILRLYNRGLVNGVKDMEFLEENELKKLEPNLTSNITCGLLAKTAGIISPYEYTVALAEESVLNGAVVKFNFDLKKHKIVNKIHYLFSEKSRLGAKWVINSSGYGYNHIAKIIKSEEYPLNYSSGDYYVLEKSEGKLVSHSIFPLPSVNSKGVVVTPTIDGNLMIGPNACKTDSFDTKTTGESLKEVKSKANEFISNINYRKNIRNFAGVRVSAGDDFIIEKSKDVANVINIAGINSPGLSSSPSIAVMVAELMGVSNNQEKVMKRRKPIIRIAGKSDEEVSSLIEKDANYGRIICKCEEVSLAEIAQAINSPLKPKSLDAIKRRTRAGMGRCQGGFCTAKLLEILSSSLKVKFEKINKENGGSNIIIGNIKK